MILQGWWECYCSVSLVISIEILQINYLKKTVYGKYNHTLPWVLLFSDIHTNSSPEDSSSIFSSINKNDFISWERHLSWCNVKHWFIPFLECSSATINKEKKNQIHVSHLLPRWTFKWYLFHCFPSDGIKRLLWLWKCSHFGLCDNYTIKLYMLQLTSDYF